MLKVSLLSLILLLGSALAHQELSDLLKKQQKDFDLSTAEVDALRPLYRELQAQYDYIYSLKLQDGDGSGPLEKQTDIQLDESYVKAFDDFRAQFSGYESYKSSMVYDTSLPTLEELIGSPKADMTEQELLEWEDLKSILQDVIDESQLGINQLVNRAIDIEDILLSLNKPKIVLAVIAGLETMWKFWGRGSQAAYCSYSKVPEFTEALHAINGGVKCYTYATGVILKIQNETVASIKEIKRNIQGLVKIWQKIAAKKTLMGQILTGTVNVFSVLRRVHDIIGVGIAGYEKATNELPGAAQHAAQCGKDFANSIPQMIETTQNLTTCITFVNPDKPEFEFTKPEEDRYWNTGKKPEDIPHENVIDEDDEEADNADDDYEDHR